MFEKQGKNNFVEFSSIVNQTRMSGYIIRCVHNKILMLDFTKQKKWPACSILVDHEEMNVA